MKNNALETLMLAAGDEAGRVLFLNVQAHADLRDDLVAVQWFYPHACGFGDVVSRIEDVDGAFDTLFMLAPKNRAEAAYLFARGFLHLKEGGRFVVAAANDAGGKSLHKMVQAFGIADFEALSKHKAKAVYGVKGANDQSAIDSAIHAGGVQDVLEGAYASQPGIFGWNKIDKGSALLTQYIPDDLSGVGADFGCGYGYLSRHVLARCSGVQTLYAIDADARAVECAKVNLTQSSLHGLSMQSSEESAGLDHTDITPEHPELCDDEKRVKVLWADLTKPQSLASLDFIIMNPPFHQNKDTDVAIGQAFIATAHAALKPSGRLYMVANAHLPYEQILRDAFCDVEKLHEGQGFKIFAATK